MVRILRLFATVFAVLILLTFCKPAGAQSYPPAWSATGTYSVGDQVQNGGNVYRCIRAVTTANLIPSQYYTYWELWEVRANTTLFIGEDETFPNFQLAWNYVLNCRIAQPVYLHMYISSAHGNFAETFSNTFSLDHPFGANISIIGDNVKNDTFSFPQSTGLTLDSGHCFGSISNLTISGVAAVAGITARQAATIPNLSSITFSGWGTAVYATGNAYVFVGTDVLVNKIPNMSTVFYAQDGASIEIYGLEIDGKKATYTIGLQADTNARVDCESCILSNLTYGVRTGHYGHVNVYSSIIEDCSNGVNSADRGYIAANDVSFSSNGTDIVCSDGGLVMADGATYSTTNVDSGTGSYLLTTDTYP